MNPMTFRMSIERTATAEERHGAGAQCAVTLDMLGSKD